jgi:small-conductance mechanosensitive channel
VLPTVRAATLIALVLATGCSSPPELSKQLETLSSWTATMQLAKERHGAGAITDTYATQLRGKADQAFQQASATIGRSARTRTDSAYAATALDSLRIAIRQLEAEIGS